MSEYFKNNNELYEFAIQLRNELDSLGKINEAKELSNVVDKSWTTASEALGALLDAFIRVRKTVLVNLPKDRSTKLDIAIVQIKEAFEKANNPN
ncbi:MAG TPA: hypothetical protein VFF49_05660 [Thermodesulfobacteriota bacterium]|nr:hypothetical protein [Thermodesulfobacteriota bacterium]